jgi:dipeptidase D
MQPLAPPWDQLEPAPVWRHFATLCAIPRASRHEAALRDHLLAWATARELPARVDAAGNLLIRKPASAGREDRPTMILQGHLDMVCQKRAGSSHDFLRDPIRPVLRDGWLAAEDTTLGADNGIGVALALAALEAENLPHGPVEVLLTVDEESGMSGAHGLSADVLTGRLMLNLDTEDWGQVYLGCAGGVDVNVDHALATVSTPAGWIGLRLTVGGLLGGHSGVDIHLERGNAIKLLVRALGELAALGLGVAGLEGGSARNALPRDAEAALACPPGRLAAAQAAVARLQDVLREELAGVDEGVSLGLETLEGPPQTVLAAEDQRRLLAALAAAPHGIRRWSRRVPGVVETSNNFGIARLVAGRFDANFMVRSLLASGSAQLAEEIVGLFALIGARSETAGAYPGWTPNPASPLLAWFQAVHQREFGTPAEVKVIHAGLECGILAAKYPGLDIVSFGPDIRGAHAPGERVSVESVGLAWRLLGALLADLPSSLAAPRRP